MSISSRISALVAAVAVDIKDLYTKYTSIVQNRVVYLPTLQINVTELTNTLMVSYTPGLLRVFHTGILLRNGVDYQAVDGIQIVFVEQLPAGTEIDVERISVQNGVELTLGGVFNTMGSLDNLTTTDKTNLVAAINEVKESGGVSGAVITTDYWTVVNSKLTVPNESVIIGGVIPGGPPSVSFTSGQYRLHNSTGDIYIINSDGTVTLHSALSDNAERIVVVSYGLDDPAAMSPGLRFYKKVNGVITHLIVNTGTVMPSNVSYLTSDETTWSNLNSILGAMGSLTTNTKTSIVSAINEVNTKSTASTTPYSSYSLNKDSEGVYTVVEIKTNSGVLYARSTLSGGTSPQYTTRTINYYGTDGTTITATNVFTINYDGDNIVSEVLT